MKRGVLVGIYFIENLQNRRFNALVQQVFVGDNLVNKSCNSTYFGMLSLKQLPPRVKQAVDFWIWLVDLISFQFHDIYSLVWCRSYRHHSPVSPQVHNSKN